MTETSSQDTLAANLRYHWDINTRYYRCQLTILVQHHHNILLLPVYDITETLSRNALAASILYHWDITTRYSRWLFFMILLTLSQHTIAASSRYYSDTITKYDRCQLTISLRHHHKILSLSVNDITETSLPDTIAASLRYYWNVITRFYRC